MIRFVENGRWAVVCGMAIMLSFNVNAEAGPLSLQTGKSVETKCPCHAFSIAKEEFYDRLAGSCEMI